MPKITIIMDDEALKELDAEIGVKSLMGQLSPRYSIMERMALGYMQAAEHGWKSILIKKEIKL